MKDIEIAFIKSLASKYGDSSYASVVCEKPFDFYVERLRRIDFKNFKSVLDVGCGFGHWSVALSKLNSHVKGFDPSQHRIEIAKKFAGYAQQTNLEFTVGEIKNIPSADLEHDAIFCYGVWMLVDRKHALREFNRVLKPGGKIYICTNAMGWWIQLCVKRLSKMDSMFWTSLKAILLGSHHQMVPNWTTSSLAANLLQRNGFKLLDYASEGHINLVKMGEPPLPCYPPKIFGIKSVVEFIAEKQPQSPVESL